MTPVETARSEGWPRTVGRYTLFNEIASGGMATVHVGRLLGPVGFSRTVAIKRLHPQYAKDPEFVSMFLDEARLASRIQHPNVVATLDVVAGEAELFLVMEYIEGEVLSKILRNTVDRGDPVPPPIVVAIVRDLLNGLHAAHEAKSENQQPLNIVHRDVSPQNVMVGVDGVARVLDFGVAKAALRAQSTRDGQIKGKISYMSPEQLSGMPIDRRADVFAAGVVAWEALCGRRLFSGDDAGEIFAKLLSGTIPSPNQVLSAQDWAPLIPESLDQAVMKALTRDPDERYATAREFAIALEAALPSAPPHKLGTWVETYAGAELSVRRVAIGEIERDASSFEDVESARTSAAMLLSGRSEEATQPDVMSSSPAVAPPGRSRGRRRSWAAALGLGVAVGVLAFGLSRGSSEQIEPRPEGLSPGSVATASDTAATVAPAPHEGVVLGDRTSSTSSAGAEGELWPSGDRKAADLAMASASVAGNPDDGPGDQGSNAERAEAQRIADEAAGQAGYSERHGGKVEGATSSSGASQDQNAKTATGGSSGSAAGNKKPVRKLNCNPPWRLDERGIRRLKPGCY